MGKKPAKLPIYKRIHNELAEEIDRLNPQPNTTFLTENKAIERFKVSRVTIRQAFDLLEQDGYIYRVQGKGTFIGPHEAKPSKTAAFIASCILHNGVESVMLRSVEEYLSKNHCNLVICNHNNEFARAENYIKRLIRSGIDAIIYVSIISDAEYEKNADLIRFMLNNNVPVVLIDRYVASLEDRVFIVEADNYRAAYEMTQHLISLGHSRIGMCSGLYCSSVDDRMRGYRQCLEDQQCPWRAEWLKVVRSENDYRAIAMQFRMMREGPTAVFVSCDEMAIRLIEAFRDFDVKVPDEIAVVGFDDFSNYTPSLSVQLTTMRVPLWEEGKLAATMVMDILKNRDIAPTHVRVPCELVIRESCGIKYVGRRLAQMQTHVGSSSP